jgi:hypothetical protein
MFSRLQWSNVRTLHMDALERNLLRTSRYYSTSAGKTSHTEIHRLENRCRRRQTPRKNQAKEKKAGSTAASLNLQIDTIKLEKEIES